MKRTTRKTSEFEAVVDATGKTLRIYVFTTFVDTSDRAGRSEAPVSIQLQLANGTHVNKVDDGKYETVEWPAVAMTSSDPRRI